MRSTLSGSHFCSMDIDAGVGLCLGELGLFFLSSRHSKQNQPSNHKVVLIFQEAIQFSV